MFIIMLLLLVFVHGSETLDIIPNFLLLLMGAVDGFILQKIIGDLLFSSKFKEIKRPPEE